MGRCPYDFAMYEQRATALCGLLMGLILVPLAAGFPGGASDSLADRYGVVARVAYKPAVVVGTPKGKAATALEDPISKRTFRYHLDVLVNNGSSWERRVAVHASSSEQASLTLAVAKAIGLLWAIADSRLGPLNSRLRSSALDVWLCLDRGPGAAEQVRRNLYIYEAMTDRTGLEWIRTLAHELGHFVLPGPVGYREPEPWSTGILGERLFLSWLRDDVVGGRLQSNDLPFVSLHELEDYCAKQPDALVERVLTRGIMPDVLKGNGKAALDEATALLLYVTHVHAPIVLQEMLIYLSPQAAKAPGGMDFLLAYERWAAAANVIQYRLPAERQEARAYVPEGRWRIKIEGGSPGGITFGDTPHVSPNPGKGEVIVKQGAWVLIRRHRSSSPQSPWSGAFTLVRQ